MIRIWKRARRALGVGLVVVATSGLVAAGAAGATVDDTKAAAAGQQGYCFTHDGVEPVPDVVLRAASITPRLILPSENGSDDLSNIKTIGIENGDHTCTTAASNVKTTGSHDARGGTATEAPTTCDGLTAAAMDTKGRVGISPPIATGSEIERQAKMTDGNGGDHPINPSAVPGHLQI